MDFEEFKEKYQKIRPEEIYNSTTSEPVLSVCVQTYQHADFIKDCLDGILMQETNFAFEILLGEDGSTDGTEEICMGYAKKFPEKIRLFRHIRENNIKINGEPTGRFNFIYNLFNARGKYLAICEGDDYWTDPLKLQKQVDFLEQNKDYFICFHPCYYERSGVNGHGQIKQNIADIDYKYSFFNLLSKWGIGTASIVLRNNINFPKWFTEVASGDIALVMSHYNSGKFKMLQDYMSVYRKTGKGVSETHQSYRMIHYRAKLYGFLNEHFNYKYQREIYSALLNIYAQNDLIPFQHFTNRKRIIRRIKNFFKKNN